jgi:predicted transcriptional regulator
MTNEEEIWKPVPGYEGYYEASTLGRIKHVKAYTDGRKRDRILVLSPNVRGYLYCVLAKDGQNKSVIAHRVIAVTFLGLDWGSEMTVDHLGGKDDNRVSMLRVCSMKDNVRQSVIRRERPVTVTPKMAEQIKKLEKTGMRQVDIADKFGISQGHVSEVCRGRTSTSKGSSDRESKRTFVLDALPYDDTDKHIVPVEGNWKRVPIKEYGHYYVSESGRVVNGVTGRVVVPHNDIGGYPRIRLMNNRKQTSYALHRVVAMAFIGMPPEADSQCNHKDRNPLNYHVSNLEWVTPSENMRHSRNTNSKMHKITEDQVTEIRRLYTAGCRVVDLASQFGIHTAAVRKYIRGESIVHSGGYVTPEPDPNFVIPEIAEEWKDIPGTKFRISNHGRIIGPSGAFREYSVGKGDFAALVYRDVSGKQYNRPVRRIVAELFIPNPNNFTGVRVINGNRMNAHAGNLAWCPDERNSKNRKV